LDNTEIWAGKSNDVTHTPLGAVVKSSQKNLPPCPYTPLSQGDKADLSTVLHV